MAERAASAAIGVVGAGRELELQSATALASVSLRFVDSVDGRRVVARNGCMEVTLPSGNAYTFKGKDGPWWEPEPFDEHSLGELDGPARTPIGPDGVHLIRGLWPGSKTKVRAVFDAHLEVAVDVAALEPGEHRAIEVPVQRGLMVSGRVVDEGGAPVTGALVLPVPRGRTDADAIRSEQERANWTDSPISLPGVPTDPLEPPMSFLLRDLSTRATTSNADGSFQISGLDFATDHVLVALTPWNVVRAELVPAPPMSDGFVQRRAESSAPRGGAADIQVFGNCLRTRGMLPTHFEYALQVGGGPWRTDDDATVALFDNDWTMTLRSLPLEPCLFRVTLRLDADSPTTEARTWTVAFSPSADKPVYLLVDLGELTGL